MQHKETGQERLPEVGREMGIRGRLQQEAQGLRGPGREVCLVAGRTVGLQWGQRWDMRVHLHAAGRCGV